MNIESVQTNTQLHEARTDIHTNAHTHTHSYSTQKHARGTHTHTHTHTRTRTRTHTHTHAHTHTIHLGCIDILLLDTGIQILQILGEKVQKCTLCGMKAAHLAREAPRLPDMQEN